MDPSDPAAAAAAATAATTVIATATSPPPLPSLAADSRGAALASSDLETLYGNNVFLWGGLKESALYNQDWLFCWCLQAHRPRPTRSRLPPAPFPAPPPPLSSLAPPRARHGCPASIGG